MWPSSCRPFPHKPNIIAVEHTAHQQSIRPSSISYARHAATRDALGVFRPAPAGRRNAAPEVESGGELVLSSGRGGLELSVPRWASHRSLQSPPFLYTHRMVSITRSMLFKKISPIPRSGIGRHTCKSSSNQLI